MEKAAKKSAAKGVTAAILLSDGSGYHFYFYFFKNEYTHLLRFDDVINC
jgi:hypothetical protein